MKLPSQLSDLGPRGKLITAVSVLLVTALVVALVITLTGARTMHLSASFQRVTGLYTGDEVRILGVKVGQIDSISQQNGSVLVDFTINTDQPVPADAKAAIVAPSLVSGRYIQLAPAYRGGPQMSDGTHIPLERTAVPVEWDQVKGELTKLTQALGPSGADKRGALADVIGGASQALGGNGATARDTLDKLSRASTALSDDSDNLFTTVRNLNDFVTALNQSGQDVRAFSNQLGSISGVLRENQGQLGTLLATTNNILGNITSFVQTNRDTLGTSVDGLTQQARNLSDDQVALANILHLAPTTLANFYNIYNPTDNSFTGRPVIAQVNGLANFACQSIFSLGGTIDDCRKALGPLLDQFNMENLPVSVNPIQQPGATPAPAGQSVTGQGGTPTPTGPRPGNLYGSLLGGPTR